MQRGGLVAVFWAIFCTFVWLSMAFLVAYPEQIVNFRFLELKQGFFATSGMERIFLPLLDSDSIRFAHSRNGG